METEVTDDELIRPIPKQCEWGNGKCKADVTTRAIVNGDGKHDPGGRVLWVCDKHVRNPETNRIDDEVKRTSIELDLCRRTTDTRESFVRRNWAAINQITGRAITDLFDG